MKASLIQKQNSIIKNWIFLMLYLFNTNPGLQ